MKITDLKCAVIGNNPIVRIVTDEGIDGFGEVEPSKHYLKPHILFYKNYIVGEDPTDVARVMMKIRRMGSFSESIATSEAETICQSAFGNVLVPAITQLLFDLYHLNPHGNTHRRLPHHINN